MTTCPWLGDGQEHYAHHATLHQALSNALADLKRATDERDRLRRELQRSDRSWAVDP